MLLQNAKTKAINQIATRFILFTKNKLAWAVACTTIGHRGWLLRTDMTVRSLAVGCHRNENKNQHARKWFYPGCHARLSSPTNDERTYISFMVTLVCIKIAFHSQRQPCDSVAGLYTIFSLLCTSVKWTTNERLRRKHAYKFPFLNKRRSSCEHVMRWTTGDRIFQREIFIPGHTWMSIYLHCTANILATVNYNLFDSCLYECNTEHWASPIWA